MSAPVEPTRRQNLAALIAVTAASLEAHGYHPDDARKLAEAVYKGAEVGDRSPAANVADAGDDVATPQQAVRTRRQNLAALIAGGQAELDRIAGQRATVKAMLKKSGPDTELVDRLAALDTKRDRIKAKVQRWQRERVGAKRPAESGFDGRRKLAGVMVDDPRAHPDEFRVRADGTVERPFVQATKNTCESVVDRLLARGHLTPAQAAAAVSLRALHEAAAVSSGGIDTTAIRVDGGGKGDAFAVSRLAAAGQLARANEFLGDTGYRLALMVAGESVEIAKAAKVMGYGTGKRDILYTGRRFRETLSDLATFWGLGAREPDRTVVGA